MLIFFTVKADIPLNSSYCCFAHATQHLLTDDPNYDKQQPPVTLIQYLCIFPRVGKITLFITSNPSTTRGEKKRKKGSLSQRKHHTHLHMVLVGVLQENSLQAGLWLPTNTFVQGVTHLVLSLQPPSTRKSKMRKFRNAMFGMTLAP